MTPKKLLILAVTVVVILFGLVIFAYVRLNGQEAQLAAQAEAIAACRRGNRTQAVRQSRRLHRSQLSTL